ncbi:hypothetical protein LOTGIDRAFT_119422, partial [Lottia gigantea]
SGLTGIFNSPNYPKKYLKYTDCQWRIETVVGSKIQLTFGDFEFENPYDWIEVRNGDSSSSELFERFSGDNLPKVIISSESELFVKMNSDFSYGMKGFNATYKIAIYCPKVLPPVNGIVFAEDNRYGASLIYKCKVGYRLVGSAEAHCQADKTWSSPTPTCQGMTPKPQ